jgi:hypothetical protein
LRQRDNLAVARRLWNWLTPGQREWVGFVAAVVGVPLLVWLSWGVAQTWPGFVAFLFVALIGLNGVVLGLLYIGTTLSKTMTRRMFLVSVLLLAAWVVTRGGFDDFFIEVWDETRPSTLHRVIGTAIGLLMTEIAAYIAAGLLLLGAHWYSRGPKPSAWPGFDSKD